MKLESKRGNIFDRAGRELAVSLDVESIFGMPNEVENPRSVARELGRILRQNPADLERRLASDRRYSYVSDSSPILWPEHFDVGITLDQVNYGLSPGDG